MDNGSHRVTLTDIFEAVEALKDDVSKLNGVAITVQDHEYRIRKTEKVMWMALGVAAISPIVSALIVAAAA